MAKLVSKIYGDALFEIAVEKDMVNLLFDQVETIRGMIGGTPELLQLLTHPKITLDEKKDVITRIFQGNICEELMGFLLIIADKGRYQELISICDYFIGRIKEYKGIGTACVTSAVRLNEGQKEKIKDKLLATTEYQEIEIDYSVDESLIGGMVIRIKDRVVDSSIKSKLYDLSKELQKIQLA